MNIAEKLTAKQPVSEATKRLNPHIFETTSPRLPHPVTQHDARAQLLDSNKAQKAGKGRFRVSIERCGTRLLDIDNAVGGAKPLLDQMRYAGLIPDDNPGCIELQFTQRKVKRAEIETVVTIEAIL